MVVQAETVPRTVDSGDVVRAGAALAAVEETGRDALTEMRRLLGCFAATATAPSSPLGPAWGGVEARVERNRENGLDVTLGVEGRRRPLTTGVDLTAYRVVEDALEAATVRGAGSAEVLLRYEADELKLHR